MKNSLRILLYRLREHLWFRPLIFSLGSMVFALIAQMVDGTGLSEHVPDIATKSLEGLLDTISASMLVISIFAVASMLSAFSSAASTATPRSFKIVIQDDVSQNALSVFIGAFIFSIVATVALDNGYYEKGGRFIIFLLTLVIFAVVILTFLRWVDRISRLGRLEHTISQVEKIASRTLSKYIKNPTRGARAIDGISTIDTPLYHSSTGYVQHLDLHGIQELAEEYDLQMRLNCLPGTFINSQRPVAFFITSKDLIPSDLGDQIVKYIKIGHVRMFDEDPRFGIIALSEIASRALSPGINDPGTAIQIISSHERLFNLWTENRSETRERNTEYDRLEVPVISIEDFIIDAFRPIARDGAGNLEVMLRLQKAMNSLQLSSLEEIRIAAATQAKDAIRRAETKMDYEGDIQILKARFNPE